MATTFNLTALVLSVCQISSLFSVPLISVVLDLLRQQPLIKGTRSLYSRTRARHSLWFGLYALFCILRPDLTRLCTKELDESGAALHGPAGLV